MQEIANRKQSDLNQKEQKKTKNKQRFAIHVAAVEKGFPDLTGKPTKICPLPISQKKQRKTVGLASNLDLFIQECGFNSKETKYVPLRSSGTDFNLKKAYERFAFMKSLERHKEKQSEYEKILRGETATISEDTVSESNTNDMLVVMEEEESSADEDS